MTDATATNISQAGTGSHDGNLGEFARQCQPRPRLGQSAGPSLVALLWTLSQLGACGGTGTHSESSSADQSSGASTQVESEDATPSQQDDDSSEKSAGDSSSDPSVSPEDEGSTPSDDSDDQGEDTGEDEGDASSEGTADDDTSSAESESGSDDEGSESTGDDPITPAELVDRLDFERFKDNIATLADFESRHWSQQGNRDAIDWLQEQLESYGYEVERHPYNYQGTTMESVYATKVGTTRPDEMYIVSGHMDSINLGSGGNTFAPGANDDASGTSLVLEAARVFAGDDVETDISIRFILWNNEETGLNGSSAYVRDRRGLQGQEDPAGSGEYPEPKWLGVIQHDKILFDHGLPPGPDQIEGADIDIEYQRRSDFADQSQTLAELLFEGNVEFAESYPSEVSDDMNNTDSKPFQDDCPSVSVRENRRVAEIGKGSDPHWHQPTDVFETFSEADFRLGYNTIQTTVGTLAKLALIGREH